MNIIPVPAPLDPFGYPEPVAPGGYSALVASILGTTSFDQDPDLGAIDDANVIFTSIPDDPFDINDGVVSLSGIDDGIDLDAGDTIAASYAGASSSVDASVGAVTTDAVSPISGAASAAPGIGNLPSSPDGFVRGGAISSNNYTLEIGGGTAGGTPAPGDTLSVLIYGVTAGAAPDVSFAMQYLQAPPLLIDEIIPVEVVESAGLTLYFSENDPSDWDFTVVWGSAPQGTYIRHFTLWSKGVQLPYIIGIYLVSE
jgi:hypothetical protein